MATKISCSSLEKYQVLVRAKKHSWISDEPPDFGDGLGPDPFEQLLGGLGSCLMITVVYNAAQSKIPLEKLFIDIEGDRPKGSPKYLIHILCRARGDLSDSDMEQLDKIAHRCPVHKILSAGTDIEMKWEKI